MATGRPRCDLPSCPIATRGRCLEGFEDFTGCGHFVGYRDSRSTPLPEVAPGVASHGEILDLPSGLALDRTEAASITAAAPTKVIYLLGEASCGKTTLLSSLFLRFQEGPYGGFDFAGSDTLCGFDRRCHLACFSRDTEQSQAGTERTHPAEGYRFLHLVVRSNRPASLLQHLLLVDVSGELLRQLRESEDLVPKVQFLRRADHLVLLLDGEKLLSPKERTGAQTAGLETLKSFLSYGLADKHSQIDVLLNKWDKFRIAGKENDSFAKKVEQSFEQQIRNRVGRLRFRRICARPEEPGRPDLENVEDLFTSWANETHPDFRSEGVSWHEPEGLTPFDRLLRQRLPQLFDGGL